MNSCWEITDVNVKKAFIKLNKSATGSSKIYFFVDLVEAKLKGNTLIVVCRDCSWVLDVESGVRRRLEPGSAVIADIPAAKAVLQDIPYYLHKK